MGLSFLAAGYLGRRFRSCLEKINLILKAKFFRHHRDKQISRDFGLMKDRKPA